MSNLSGRAGRGTRILLVLGLVAAPAGAALFEDVDLTLLGYHSDGDYGSGVDSTSQGLVFRLTTGQRTQLWLDVPVLRSRALPENVIHTGHGPMPVRSRGQGPDSPGPGHGPMGPGGGGPGEPEPPVEGGEAGDWVEGLGDLRLGLTLPVVGGGAEVFGLWAQLGVKAPTADETENLGTGEWDARLGLSTEYRFWSLTAFGGLGWSSLGDPEGLRLEDIFDAYAGVESEPLGGRVLVSGWLEGNEAVVSGAGDRLVAGVGLRTLGKVRWRGGLELGLSTGAEDFSGYFGVSFGVARPTAGRSGVAR